MGRDKNKMNAEKFRELFVHREDNYTVQLPSRAHIPTDQVLTDDVIQKHLNGEQTIGLYQIIPEQNTLKWAVVDIDLDKPVYTAPNFNLDDWLPKLLEQTRYVEEIFEEKGIPFYTEFSGYKGYHVWVFFKEPVSSEVIYTGLREMMNGIKELGNIHLELFPKQAKVEKGGSGNLVKGPNGKHLTSGKYSHFTNINDFGEIKYAKEDSFKVVTSPVENIFKKCVSMHAIREKAFKEKHLTNDELLALGYILINASHNHGEDEGEKYLREVILPKLSNYDPEISNYHIEAMKTAINGKGYKPIRCRKLQEQKLCPGQCRNIGSWNSPIVFYKKALGDAGELAEILGDPLENYRIIDGGYYEFYPNADPNKNEPLYGQLTNFIIDISEEISIDDGITVHKFFNGTIKGPERSAEFQVSVEKYFNAEGFKVMIANAIGIDGIFIHRDLDKIRHCVNKFADTERREITQVVGYYKDNETDLYPNKYCMPSVIITKDGVFDNDSMEYDLSDEDLAEGLDLIKPDDENYEIAKQGLKDLLDLSNFEYTHSALAHTFLPIIFPFIKGERTKYTYFVRGRSGDGKSYVMKFFQNFYGVFNNLMSWTSTATALHNIGYLFKDTLYIIDDFKLRNFGGKNSSYDYAITLMQNYADNTSRARSRSDLKMQKTKTISGFLASTGEDTPGGEASTLARTILVDCQPRTKNRVKGKAIERIQHLFPMFTSKYIQHALNLNPDKISIVFEKYENEFHEHVKGNPNDARVSRNVALMMTSYKYISEFLWNSTEAHNNQSKFKNFLVNKTKEQVNESAEEMASELFLSTLQEAIATKELRLQDDDKTFLETDRVPIIGWRRTTQKFEDEVCIIGQKAYAFISKKLDGELAHSLGAIIKDLHKKGLILDDKQVPRKFNKQSVKVMVFKAGIIK
jgi:hypothetical protein